MFIKIIDGNNEFIKVENIEYPMYCAKTARGDFMLCPKHRATGVLSADNSEVYQLSSAENCGVRYTAVEINIDEYERLDNVDLEDEHPMIDGDIPIAEEEILTRAELTAKVAALEEQNEMLMSCLLEMSEAVYA